MGEKSEFVSNIESKLSSYREKVARFIGGRALIEQMESLAEKAYLDNMTQLLNREASIELLTTIMEAEPDLNFAVLFIDFNELKSVNDILGHSYGDRYLVVGANAMSAQVRKDKPYDLYHNIVEGNYTRDNDSRPSDIVGRRGGDEFTVLMAVNNKLSAERITAIKQGITDELHDYLFGLLPVLPPAKSKALSRRLDKAQYLVSIGYSDIVDIDDIDQAIQRADEDMYQDKARHAQRRRVARIEDQGPPPGLPDKRK